MMVDIVSAEAKRKELLDESLSCVYPEDAAGIKQRYKDTSLVLFKEQLKYLQGDNRSYLSFGTRRSSTVSEYGNTPIIFRKSRSANGELSKVGEQWPSLRGRASLSNYTLHEGKEQGGNDNEEEETETEDEFEEQTVKPSEEKKKIVITHGKAVCETKVDDTGAALQNNDGSQLAEQKEKDNRKSFSHYDLHSQKPRDFIDEARDGDVEEAIDDDDKDAVSMRTVLEVEGVDHKILLVRSASASGSKPLDPNPQNKPSSKQVDLVGAGKNQKDCHGNQTAKTSHESREPSTSGILGSSDVDHSAVLREYVEKSSSVNNAHSNRSSAELGPEGSVRPSSNDWSKVELRIVEPSDLIVPDNVDEEKVNGASKSNGSNASSLTGVEDIDDNDDVVYIDEFSPSMKEIRSQKEKKIKSCENRSQEVLPLNEEISPVQEDSAPVQEDSAPVPPKRKTKQTSEASSPLPSTSQDLEIDAKADAKEELNKSVESDDQSGLKALPVRSPTPPKRSPRRSLQSPKIKVKSHELPPSSEVSSDQKQQLKASSNASSMSASPVSKSKETKKDSTSSSKKGRSKSITSLTSKKNKQKEKVGRSGSEDTGAQTQAVTPDPEDDGSCENPSGKRVGVRSMAIDGTIKRNFIVIHPSDDSETIGLAPVSSFTNGGKKAIKTPKALSSVKSHITGVSSTKGETAKKSSAKQDRKGSLKASKESIQDRDVAQDKNLDKGKGKKFGSLKKKQTGKLIQGSSVSLSSAAASPKAASESTEGMSEVDCDLVNASSHGVLPLSSTKTPTSRLCVVM